MKTTLLLLLLVAAKFCGAQKIDSIYFHLYTDSLKKGFYNYINVDGKTSTGRWWPLTTSEVVFSVPDTTHLRFQNNDLFVDSAFTGEVVVVRAVLRSNPAVWKEIVIPIRKRGFDEPLMTNEEAIREYTKPKKKKG